MIRRARIVLAPALAIVLVACSTSGAHPSGSFPSSEGSPTPASLTVGLGYIPSVQFAPFYLAQQNGYYAQAGLKVAFQNKIETDLVVLVGQGSIDIGVADGTDVIPAVSQGIPIRYVTTLYGTYPSIVFAKASSGISSAADLKGRKIGIPGRYGSSWIMLQALLGSANLTPEDVTIVEYPDFGQGIAVQQGAVDAATGFANNEPVQLELAGTKTVVLHVDDIVALPGPGLIAGTKVLGQTNAVQLFIEATLRAMREIAADPQKGLDATFALEPDLGKPSNSQPSASPAQVQLAILRATIATWSGKVTAAGGYGAIDKVGWQASIDFMTKLGLVPKPVTVGDVVRTDLLPASPAPTST